MSLLDRISPWRRSQRRRSSFAAETRATRDALTANIAGLARAMEERFTSIAERIDESSAAQAAEAERLADTLSERLEDAFGQFRSTFETRLDAMKVEIAAMRHGHDFARVLSDLKRDLGAQISLSSFEAAQDMRAAILSAGDPIDRGRLA